MSPTWGVICSHDETLFSRIVGVAEGQDNGGGLFTTRFLNIFLDETHFFPISFWFFLFGRFIPAGTNLNYIRYRACLWEQNLQSGSGCKAMGDSEWGKQVGNAGTREFVSIVGGKLRKQRLLLLNLHGSASG